MNSRQQILKPRRTGIGWILIISVTICLSLIHVWVRMESTQTILRISKAQAEHAKLLSYRKALALERDRLKSDARITEIAASYLGLSPNLISRTIYLDKKEL